MQSGWHSGNALGDCELTRADFPSQILSSKVFSKFMLYCFYEKWPKDESLEHAHGA